MTNYLGVEIPKTIKVKNLLKALKSIGFYDAKGSKHYKYKDNQGRTATITRSSKEIDGHYVRIIFSQIGLTEQEAQQVVNML